MVTSHVLSIPCGDNWLMEKSCNDQPLFDCYVVINYVFLVRYNDQPHFLQLFMSISMLYLLISHILMVRCGNEPLLWGYCWWSALYYVTISHFWGLIQCTRVVNLAWYVALTSCWFHMYCFKFYVTNDRVGQTYEKFRAIAVLSLSTHNKYP